MHKSFISYLGLYMAIFLALSTIEVFLLKPLVDFIGTSFWTHIVVYSLMFIIVNPILCKLIGNLIITESKETETSETKQSD